MNIHIGPQCKKWSWIESYVQVLACDGPECYM